MKVIPFPSQQEQPRKASLSGKIIVSVFADETGTSSIEVETDFSVSDTTDILVAAASIMNTPELLIDSQSDPLDTE